MKKMCIRDRAYWQSKGLPRGGKKTQPNPYRWCKTTVAKMLTQQEYCGDVINFKTYSKSFRNKTRIDNPQENWAVFRDVHEPIIDRETFERVQQIVGKVKQRHLKNPEEDVYKRQASPSACRWAFPARRGLFAAAFPFGLPDISEWRLSAAAR